MDTGLAGKTVIVTGGNANIGRGIVLAFAAEGAKLVIVGRDEAQGLRVADEARDQGAADLLWVKADLLERGQVERMVARVLEQFSAIDVMVNNVGGNVDFAPFAESGEEQWEKEIALNLTTTLRCTRLVLPHMIERKGGRIVNIGSTAGLVGDPLIAAYSAAKGGVHTFTKVLAKEVGQHGITVNAVAPTGTFPEDAARDTSTGSRYHPTEGLITRALATRAGQLMTLQRRSYMERSSATPAEVGAAAVFFASKHSGFTTGQILYIEGGCLL
jgi:2-hydroxycyclohexanecarboxyl-CoA dehydrogenase